MKRRTSLRVGTVLACLCLGMLASCTQAKDKNVTSFLPGPIVGLESAPTPSSGTGVGSFPLVPTQSQQPTTSISPLVSAPTLPPVPTPNAIPSIVPVPTAAPAPEFTEFTKAFLPNPVTVNTPTTLEFQISNPNSVNLTGLAFTDTLPSGLVVASPLNFTNGCGGVLTAGQNVISLTNGTLGAGQACTINVDVVSGAVGSYINPAVTLTSNEANPAQSTPVNLVVDLAPAPGFTKAFLTNPATFPSPTTLEFQISNPNSVNLTGLAFTDTLPSGLVVASPLNFTNGCGGVLTAGQNVISLTNGTLGAGQACTINVDVVSSSPPPPPFISYINPAVTLTSNEANPAQSTPVNVIYQ
ncbi:MAG: DUF7933 domain-containing protein [Cyanobacteriota bacterium]